MPSVIKYYEGIKSVAVLGNYMPRRCGIATFTTDLVEGLAAEAPDIFNWAAAMNDRPEGYAYPEKVRFEINQNKLNDYSVASQFINISQTDIVCVQHEYGLFGGPAGSHHAARSGTDYNHSIGGIHLAWQTIRRLRVRRQRLVLVMSQEDSLLPIL